MSIKIQNTTIINDQTAYIDFAPTNAVKVPTGTLGERPSPVTGQMRFNTTDATLEGYYRTTWCPIGSFGVNLCLGPTIRASIYSTGLNSSGQLGDGTATRRCSFVREICSATNWCAIYGSCSSFSAIKKDGSLWSWGFNNCGQLGDGATVNKCSPVRERCSATDWCQVSVGGCFSIGVKSTGQLWAWGDGTCGKLGNGSVSSTCSPVREFCLATNWCQAAAGQCRSSAIKTDGSIWDWGKTCSCSPVREFCSATNWCLVSSAQSGFGFTTAIKTDGSLWSWGCLADCGMFGIGIASFSSASPVREFCSATNWCDVNGADRHAVALKSDGTVWSWGSGYRGGLGDGTTVSKCSPVREFCSATNWCRLGKGNSYGANIIKTDGSLWSWGYHAALGNGAAAYSSDICSPVREIRSFTNWNLVSGDRVSVSAMTLVTPF